MNVISNAGPLIALGKLNRLELLADVYGQVEVTRAVYSEVVTIE
jgi:predicted nucleic acid-binding protein